MVVVNLKIVLDVSKQQRKEVYLLVYNVRKISIQQLTKEIVQVVKILLVIAKRVMLITILTQFVTLVQTIKSLQRT